LTKSTGENLKDWLASSSSARDSASKLAQGVMTATSMRGFGRGKVSV
jgi:hypothetical protein